MTNHGEVPQYHVTSNHEAIIEPEISDRVQDMMKQRGNRRREFGRFIHLLETLPEC